MSKDYEYKSAEELEVLEEDENESGIEVEQVSEKGLDKEVEEGSRLVIIYNSN